MFVTIFLINENDFLAVVALMSFRLRILSPNAPKNNETGNLSK